MAKITVLGAGSWGTALSLRLAHNQNQVTLWGHRAEHIKNLQEAGENKRYLPNFIFPKNLQLEAELEKALYKSELILAVVPSAHFVSLLKQIKPHSKNTPIMWAIKGFEHGTGRLLSDVFKEHFGENHPHALLAGPSFAKEVAQGLPTAVSICAPKNPEHFARPFHGSNFLCYTDTDLIGAQTGGAVKNVIAIATGIADGMGGGANTRAALITRGLREITRLATTLGGKAQTLAGLAGMGDLILTATDQQSRNRRFGLALGEGKSIAQAKNDIQQVIEGEGAAHDSWQLAQKHHIHMPIVEHIHYFLKGDLNLEEAIHNLSNRSLKTETL